MCARARGARGRPNAPFLCPHGARRRTRTDRHGSTSGWNEYAASTIRRGGSSLRCCCTCVGARPHGARSAAGACLRGGLPRSGGRPAAGGGQALAAPSCGWRLVRATGPGATAGGSRPVYGAALPTLGTARPPSPRSSTGQRLPNHGPAAWPRASRWPLQLAACGYTRPPWLAMSPQQRAMLSTQAYVVHLPRFINVAWPFPNPRRFSEMLFAEHTAREGAPLPVFLSGNALGVTKCATTRDVPVPLRPEAICSALGSASR